MLEGPLAGAAPVVAAGDEKSFSIVVVGGGTEQSGRWW